MGERSQQGSITALYIRVSTDMQAEEGYSIDFQSQALLSFCKAKDYKNERLYIDGGWSGSNLDRPHMQELINDIKARRVERVIVYKLDRLSRSQKDTLYLIEDVFLPHGVSFISINESFDTSTPFGRAMIGILSTFAQLERENIRERTRSGMLERVKEGYWPGGGHIPFGYDYDKEKGILVPNKDADTVRKIYDMYIAGASTYKICSVLGLKYDSLAVQILQRKTNIGIISYLGKDYKGKHEPIVSEEIYNQAMWEMQRRSRHASYSDTNYLFSGLLVCGCCGAKIRYQKYKYGVKMYCYSREKSRPHLVKDPNCPNMAYDADAVEKEILENLFNKCIHVSEDDQVKARASLPLIEELHRQKKIVEAKIIRLYSLFAEDGDELLIATIKKQQQEMAELNERLELEERKEANHSISLERVKILSNLREVWDDLSFDQKRGIIRDCIKEIVLTNGHIKIHYNLI